MMPMAKIIAGLATLMASGASAQALVEVWTLDGFTNPEASHWDEGSDRIVVSQMGTFGPEGGMDGKLSLLSVEGEVIDEAWVTGLADPKGMASGGGTLHVVDSTGLVAVDVATGTVSETIAVPDAMLLNDVAIDDDGAIFVTDLAAGGLVRIQGGVASALVRAGDLSLPNGILAQDGTLIVGSFGEGELSAAFTVETPGGLLLVDPETGTGTPIAVTTRQASVDGIATLDGWLVFADNPTGRVFGLRDDVLTFLGELEPGIADLGATPDLLIVPNSVAGTVTAYRLE